MKKANLKAPGGGLMR
jgi:large subunit ribosomal protein L36